MRGIQFIYALMSGRIEREDGPLARQWLEASSLRPKSPKAGRLDPSTGVTPILLALALLVAPLHAGHVLSPSTVPDSGFDVRVESWLEQAPPCGMVPLKITITNGSKSAGQWSFSTQSRAGSAVTGTQFGVGLAAGESGEWEMIAPGCADASSYHYFSITTQGDGIAGGFSISLPSTTASSSSSSTAFIAMGKRLGQTLWPSVESRMGSSSSRSGSNLRGSKVEIVEAPTDWRGYTGVTQLWMSEQEWTRTIREDAKRAALAWVATGGRLIISVESYGDERFADLKIPGGGVEHEQHSVRQNYGAGSVEIVDDSDPDKAKHTSVAMKVIERSGEESLSMVADRYRTTDLRTRLSSFTLAGPLIFFFVLIFGIVAGPVNLFVLAGGQRRHRLFFTTPVIALAGTALLLVLMLFRDGTGGTGNRKTVCFLCPDQNIMAVVQEQSSRTGVLLGRSFPVSEPVWMQQLPAADQSDRHSNYADMKGNYNESPTSRSGDWFRSRSVQTQLLKTVRPSRGGLEVSTDADGKMWVTSSIQGTLKKVLVRDADKNAYRLAENLGAGERVELKQVDIGEATRNVTRDVKNMAGPVTKEALDRLETQPGWFFATFVEPGQNAIPTLASIKWTTDESVICGPVTMKSK